MSPHQRAIPPADQTKNSPEQGSKLGNTKMNTTNNSIEANLNALLSQHGLTVKSRQASGAFADHVTVNESGAEFSVGALTVEVKHPQGGWMNVDQFTTAELLSL